MARHLLAILALVLLTLAGCRPREMEGCRTVADCMPTELCRSGECVMRECDVSDDCASGACDEGLCVACSSESDCDEGEVCSGGDCTERECVATSDCTGGEACVGGVCLPCTSDGQCSAGDACHHGSCVERECFASTECSGGLVCDMGRCLPCGPSVACEGLLACIDGACGACTTDAECGTDRRCRSGQCFTLCTVDGVRCSDPGVLGCRDRTEPLPCGEAFCAGDFRVFGAPSICDACLSASGGCRMGTCDDDLLCPCATNADCPDELTCNGGRCVPCSTDAQCGCDRYCAADECHDRCDDDDDCPRGRCHPESGRCVPCLTDAECGGGRCFEDGCQGLCGSLLSCAPFVPCGDNMRCGFCSECATGPRNEPVAACP